MKRITNGRTREWWHGLPKGKKRLVTVYAILRFSVIVIMIARLIDHDYESAFLCVLTLILFLIPSFFERRLHIDVPDTLEIMVLLFIYAAEILGEVHNYYIAFPYWDTLLHTVNGFLCAAIGFSLVDLLNRHHESISFSLSPVYMAVMAFCFSMTIGVIWEFFEYAMDHIFLFDMQKDTILNSISTVMLDPGNGTKPITVKDIADVVIVHSDGTQQSLGLGGYLDIGLMDTIEDLFVNFIGAAVFSVIGYFYVKTRGKGEFVSSFILKAKDRKD